MAAQNTNEGIKQCWILFMDFCPSEEAKERIADLIHREKTTGLTSEETIELNHCLQLEHLMGLAKSRARYYWKNE